MIYNIKGELILTDTSFVVVSCGGVGFKCMTSLNTIKQLEKVGSEVNLFTHLVVRDDAMELYGFCKMQELEFFKLLISVSGIGPKAAASILSELTADKLAICIATGDTKALTKAQGVGKKTAERVVLELKDKIGSIVTDSDVAGAVNAAQQVSGSGDCSEAVEALVSLGYNQSEASMAISQLPLDLPVDDMIRQGLKILSRQV